MKTHHPWVELYQSFWIAPEIKYERIGDGWCRPNCNIKDSSCRLNAIQRESSSYEECKGICDEEPACTGFAISDSTFFYPNRCYIYGNLTSANVENWNRPGLFTSKPHSHFEVNTTNGNLGIDCYKKIDEQVNEEGE